MHCPCGSADVPPRDFRAWLRATPEARLAARQVVKGETFGGAVVERRGAGLYFGPDGSGSSELDPAPIGAPARGCAASAAPGPTPKLSGVVARLRGLLGGRGA